MKRLTHLRHEAEHVARKKKPRGHRQSLVKLQELDERGGNADREWIGDMLRRPSEDVPWDRRLADQEIQIPQITLIGRRALSTFEEMTERLVRTRLAAVAFREA